MAVNERHEFEQLLAAHTNRDLTGEELARLVHLAEGDATRAAALADVEGLHALFQEEREVALAVMSPADPAEESDEGYRRLAKTAARAESKLRAQLRNPSPGFRGRVVGSSEEREQVQRRPVSWMAWSVAAAAVVLLSLGLLGAFETGAPDLSNGGPAAGELGGSSSVSMIHRDQVLTADNMTISWRTLPNARSYRATISNAINEDVLRRPESLNATTLWQLTEQEYQLLKNHEGELYLRITAQDGTGRDVGNTGDVKLLVK